MRLFPAWARTMAENLQAGNVSNLPILGIVTLERFAGRIEEAIRQWPLSLIFTLGLLTRTLSVFFMDIQHDGAAYVTMGKTLAEHHNLILPFGDGMNFNTNPAPSRQYPPLYPGYLASWYAVLGYGILQTKLANLTLALVAPFIVFYCTNRLYGSKTAWYTAALFSVIPRFSMAAGTGFSENLGAIIFTLTLWTFLEGLKRPHYFLWTGILAGACYLIRGSMGPFFFLGAGFIGFFVLRKFGLSHFKNPWPIMGGIAFLCIAGAWAWRNHLAFGTTDAGGYGSALLEMMHDRPIQLIAGLFFKFAQYATILYLFYGVFQAEWKQSRQEWFLWLIVAGMALLGITVSAINYAVEQSPPLWMDSERYLSLAYVPLLWLLFKKDTPQPRTLQPRFMILASLFILASTYEILEPTTIPESRSAAHLDLHGGETIAIYNATLARYTFYPYLPRFDVKEELCFGPPSNPCIDTPEYIIGTKKLDSPHYTLFDSETNHFLIGGNSQTIYTYRLNHG